MPERTPRRRRHSATNATRKCIRPPNPSPSSRRRASPPVHYKRSFNSNKPSRVRVLTRSASEPILRLNTTAGEEQEEEEEEASRLGHDHLLYPKQGNHSNSFADAFSSSSPSLLGLGNSDGYSSDAKVVVNVTVEGSPGPVRAMVKLGSTVDDAIKLVMNKYREEGRTPKLGRDSDRHQPSSSYELHQSHFSLRCLEKSELIGDVGSRSFYLRRSGSLLGSRSPPEGRNSPPAVALQSFFARTLSKVVRRTRRVWNILVCLQ